MLWFLWEPSTARWLFPQDIDHRRVIVGFASRVDGRPAGFILKDGRFTFVECPGINGQLESTVFRAINRDGAIGGDCFGSNSRGFVYRDGTFTFVQYPGSTDTRVFDINANGDLVGDAEVPDFGGTKRIAFLYRNGVFHDLSLTWRLRYEGELVYNCPRREPKRKSRILPRTGITVRNGGVHV